MAECEICGEEYAACRKLTQGSKKHPGNLIRRLNRGDIESDNYCVDYNVETTEGGGNAIHVGCTIYLHKKQEQEKETAQTEETGREDMLFDCTLHKNRKQLREGEIHATSAGGTDFLSSDLNFILQHLIKSVQNLDERLRKIEEK